MGNQPSRKNIPKKGGSSRHSDNSVKSTKKMVSSKKYSDAAIISLGSGLKDSGNNFLAAGLLATARAYNLTRNKKAQEIPKITSRIVTKVLREQNLDVTKQGRAVLKSTLSSILSSKRVNY